VILRGVEYGRAWTAAGANNFLGQGYPFHRWLKPFGLAPDFRGATLVAKTTTLEPRVGRMPLRRDLMPRELYPRCIRVNFRKAAVLNAVGLSGPGLEELLRRGVWQSMLRPFVLSFMAVDGERDARLDKAVRFAGRLASERPRFRAPFVLEVNCSCPNIGLGHDRILDEVNSYLDVIHLRLPGVPLIPKLNVLVPPAVAAEIGKHPACAAICCSNTVPWGALPDRIDWEGLFGAVSPLAEMGGGGLSGAPLTPLVREWAAEYCAIPGHAPLVACGGVMTADDARALLLFGAAAVELGSVALLRPWRVKGIVETIGRWKGG
jgi:dihydroorotate dehydrogenase